MGLRHNSFAGKKALTNGLIDPAPSTVSVMPGPTPAAEVGAEVDAEVEAPPRSPMKSRLRASGLRSKNLSDE